MNATARKDGSHGLFGVFGRPQPLIYGICARLAARSRIPCWAIRVVAVVLLMAHALLVGGAYLLAAAWLRRSAGETWTASAASLHLWHTKEAPSGNREFGGLADRFARLDRRLARMEAEAVSGEWTLRRRFRDLR